MDFPTLTKLPPIMTSGRGSLRSKATFDMDNPYNSQSLAAGGSALLDAINRGKVHLAKFILDAGEYGVANTKDFKGKTPLIRACYIREMSTRDKAVKLLLRKGADVNAQDDSGRTALSYACELRCNDIVRILVKNNVDPDIPDQKGNTSLIYSAMSGNDTAVDILLRSFRRLGLNVDHINEDGMTALIIAAKNGYIACATNLAADGKACLSFRDKEKGWNAEDWARAHGCSTPEVIPFSPNAQLYQIKMAKFLKYSEKCDDEEEDDDENDIDESSDDDSCLEKEQRKKIQKNILAKEPSENDEITKLTSEITNLKMYQARFQLKRGSLPAIKLSGNNSPLKLRKSPVDKFNLGSPFANKPQVSDIKIIEALKPTSSVGIASKFDQVSKSVDTSKSTATCILPDITENKTNNKQDEEYASFLPPLNANGQNDNLSDNLSSSYDAEGHLLSSSKVEIGFECGATNAVDSSI